MPRRVPGLTVAEVKTKPPGRYCDGGGLYLLVRSPEAKFWLFRYTPRGAKLREMGLGPATGRYPISLAEARRKAAELHRLLRSGVDPLAQRDAAAAAARTAAAAARARATTFRDAGEQYIAANETGWKNDIHRAQWRATLATYVYPHIGDLPVADVETAHVMAALEPIWTAKPETASRVRGRIETVLDYAKARGWRSGDNPARWRGHIANMLPKRAKVAAVQHHAALPWRDIGAFMARVRSETVLAARVLELIILTVARC